MARLFGRIGGIWMVLSVPSLVVWGLVVRWSDAGSDRFERVWRWFADLITLPLILRPLTDRCFDWLDHGNAVEATVGFAVVVIVWCLMFAVPLAVIWSWADWVGRRTTPSTTTSPYASSGYALTSGGDPTGAINALYLFTIPAALLWHMALRLLACLPIAIVAFIIAWVIRYLVVLAQVAHGDRFALGNKLAEMDGVWNGTWQTLRFDHLYGSLWDRTFPPTSTFAVKASAYNSGYTSLFDHAGDHGYVFWFLATEAALWATAIALAVWVIAVVFWGPSNSASTT